MSTTDGASSIGENASPPKRLRGRNENHGAWLLRRIWDRLHRKNEHFMGVIVGREGSGKSHTAIKIASTVDPTFTADRVMFDVTELLEVLRNGDHEKGNFYVLDEAGVQFGRRTWQERGQVLANQALQLIRNHNLGLVFTLPRLGELDSQAQGRLQAFYELMDKVDGEYVTGKWKWMDPDRADETGEIYKKFPRRRENGRVKRITEIAFTPPEPEIVEPYEAKKSEFQDEFYKKTIEQLSDEEDGEDDEKSVKEWATEIAQNGIEKVVSEHGNTGEKYINKELIHAQYEVSKTDARAIKALLDKQIDASTVEV
jgi:hypothetical protein